MTLLVRIRLPLSLLTRLDMLGADVRAVVHRRVARAALMRALIQLALDSAVAPEVVQTLGRDPIHVGDAAAEALAGLTLRRGGAR